MVKKGLLNFMNLNEIKLLSQINRGSAIANSCDLTYNIPSNERRGHYLGMSGIGNHACDLWLDYHKPDWYINLIKDKKIDDRVNRIFLMGKIIELMTIDYIRLGGGTVSELQRDFSDFNNKYRGHWDGLWNNSYILEIKGMNNNNFDHIKYSKNLKEDLVVYYSQCQSYMYYSGVGKTLLLVYNKNTSEYTCREIEYDESYAKLLKMKAYSIVTANSPLNIPKLFRGECDDCEYKSYCNANDQP